MIVGILVPLDPIADSLFPIVAAFAERVAKAIARAVHATDSRVLRVIEFLVYLLIVCPLLLLAVATVVTTVRWLIQLAGTFPPYA